MEHKFFKMFQSYRPQHTWQDETGRWKSTLFCVDCEVKQRESEFASWSQEQRDEAGFDYPTLGRVKKEQKDRAREGWALRAESLVNAKASLKAERNNKMKPGESVIHINFLQCKEIIINDEEKGEKDDDWEEVDWGGDGAGGDGVGASNDGPHRPTSAELHFPDGRGEDKLVAAMTDKRVTSKEFKKFVISKSKDLARALMV